MPTVSSLVRELKELGVREGMTLLVHSSLYSIGWVPGGAVAVIHALQRAVGDSGTLVMPTHTGNLSDPARWQNPPAPESWWERIREEMPAFDKTETPVYGMGTIPETFRRMDGVKRSAHPHMSFAAWGKHADDIVRGHGENPAALDYGLGENSPLARVYDLDGRVLLIGVGHDSNTSLHLCEYRADYEGKSKEVQRAPVIAEGVRKWVQYNELEFDTDDFEALGADFERERPHSGDAAAGKLGMAETRLLRQRALVDYGTGWIARNRKPRR
ncbi:aminoglycoside N(3)-acetyltransferase [Paenibacillus thermotolerans]|uniref:aminoglycoside N(3)-acetyltransferase n=1 Tax=Paenibacillus thermotolerans TaxID=3027807 RepID=UPI0023682E0C|nr:MULTISPECIES: AAC(3) family N-acetyltransferase [unclassified Paenibacillus]